jgi:hypothetical protein
LKSPHRETPKNVIKQNRQNIGFGLFVELKKKAFRHDFFAKRFLQNAFWRCETPENAIKPKEIEEKLTPNCFDMEFLHKIFVWCF